MIAKAIHVLRRPLCKAEGSVASNVLKHGCGGINIDETRVSTRENLTGGAYAKNPTPRAGKDMWSGDRKGDTQVFKRGGAGEYKQPEGRWPSNLILQHKSDCQCVGETSTSAANRQPTGKALLPTTSVWNSNSVKDTTVRGHADANGQEHVAVWKCERGSKLFTEKPPNLFETGKS